MSVNNNALIFHYLSLSKVIGMALRIRPRLALSISNTLCVKGLMTRFIRLFDKKTALWQRQWHHGAMSTLTLPLFPLNTLLFPDGLLHLQIFELRYLTLVKQCIANGTEFGVVAQAQKESSKTDEPMANEAFTRCGTSAKIVAHSAPMAGLLRIECVGTQRFEVVSSAQQKLGLWVAQVEPVAADQVVAVPAELEDTVTALRNVINTLQSRAANPEHTLILPPYRFDDCGWVANRWCELIPMPADQQQGLLTLDNPLIRLELVQDMLTEQGLLT